MGVRDRAVNTWRYQLEANGGGIDVTESFELANTAILPLYWKIAGRARGRTNVNGMRSTLDRIKAEAESAPDGVNHDATPEPVS